MAVIIAASRVIVAGQGPEGDRAVRQLDPDTVKRFGSLRVRRLLGVAALADVCGAKLCGRLAKRVARETSPVVDATTEC